jgi:MazG family protein
MMLSAIDEFVQTIARLRAPDGCPWDREQTHRTLCRYLLEETYEVLEAIDLDDPPKLCEELGDLLLQIVLNAQIASESETNRFSFSDVAAGINTKMIERHPHVFGDAKVDSAEEVVARWEERKREQRGIGSAVDDVPNALPALLKALKVSEKAVGEGFEWENIDQIFDQLHSEIDELKEELRRPDAQERKREIELEIGDILFTVVNIARWQDLNPEESLLFAIEKFRRRYRKMGELSEKPLSELSMNELDSLWRKAKVATSNM